MSGSRRIVKMRNQPSGPGGAHRYRLLTVPQHIGELCEAAGVTHFAVEMTEEGILYRPVTPNPIPVAEPLPAWLQTKEVAP